MKIESIEIGGPFDMHIVTKDGATFWLRLNGGEWRLDGLWLAQGRIGRWDALARACRKVEEGEPP